MPMSALFLPVIILQIIITGPTLEKLLTFPLPDEVIMAFVLTIPHVSIK